MSDVEQVLHIQNILGEGPIWHHEEQTLYWVDIQAHYFYRLDPATGRYERFDIGLPVGAVAFRATGGLVLATKDGFAFWSEESQVVAFIADPEAHKPDSRFNDGSVDRQGRFWAGTMGQGPTSCLYRLDPDGSVHTLETGIEISNGIGWSPDNKIMYYTDSPKKIIYAYDFDPASGAIENRRSFVATPDEAGVPDGLTVDSEGFVWSARWDGWKISRYGPSGKVEREIRLPIQRPTSCAFGGAALNELYITSASTGLSDEEKAKQPMAGDIFRVRMEIKGLPEPEFLG